MKKSILAIFIIVLLFTMSMSVGGSGLGVLDFIMWLRGEASESSSFIFFNLRLPRTITGLLVGSSLGFSGALLQTMLSNPLAEPYTLGLSGGASLGAVLAILI